MALNAPEYGYEDDQEGFLKWKKRIMKCYSDSPIVFFLSGHWKSLEQCTQKYWELSSKYWDGGFFYLSSFACMSFLQNEWHIIYYI